MLTFNISTACPFTKLHSGKQRNDRTTHINFQIVVLEYKRFKNQTGIDLETMDAERRRTFPRNESIPRHFLDLLSTSL